MGNLRDKRASNRRITQGGMLTKPGERQPDVVLQMPELFHFNLQHYMNAVTSAQGIDYSNRVRLYDMYESANFDLHLTGVMAKRLRGVTQIPVEFKRDGKPDEAINKQLRSPWFKELRKELILSEFWGFTLVQFRMGEDGNIRVDSIDRKHYDPVHRLLLRYQGDIEGEPIELYPNTLFVGSERGLGIFAEILPAVLYKKGNMGDWARFNKTGSSELYRTFAEYWDSKISIRVLGNTLTTDAKSTGTQALGTIHKEEEDEMNADDREFILDVLNYQMRDIFAELGFNTDGGEFVYAKKDKVDVAQQIDIVQKCANMGLPIDDDYLYETFGIAKPENYSELKTKKEEERAALRERMQQEPTEPTPPTKPIPPTNALSRFFGVAPKPVGADNDF